MSIKGQNKEVARQKAMAKAEWAVEWLVDDRQQRGDIVILFRKENGRIAAKPLRAPRELRTLLGSS